MIADFKISQIRYLRKPCSCISKQICHIMQTDSESGDFRQFYRHKSAIYTFVFPPIF